MSHTQSIGSVRTAFSLIEVLVVVLVIGILAAVVVPNTINAGDEARVTATSEDLRGLAEALDHYRGSNGRWPADRNRGILPPELADTFSKNDPFLKAVPVGGTYDYDAPRGTRPARIAIRGSRTNPAPLEELALELDAELDDGNFETGRLRRNGNTLFYYVTDPG